MTQQRKTPAVSLLIVLGGGMVLTTPAGAATGGERFDCRETVRAYCQWVADNYCSTGATCKYNTSTCQVVDTQCNEA